VRYRTAGPARPLALVARAVCAAAAVWTHAWRLIRGTANVGRFASRGEGLRFDPDGTYTYENIHLGDNVNLGVRPVIIAARSRVRIGSNVMFGPEVTIRGGNHRTDVVGTPMIAVGKRNGDERFDRGVVIEDDVWIGTRAVILHGVTVGRGAVVGAGAVVTRSVPPYAIVAGNPARVVRLRWSVDVIREHERLLYPPQDRLPVEELARLVGCREDGDRASDATVVE
jgi:chloramphenicol O-acetyltransferase type B